MLGDIKWLTFRNKEQRERDKEEYEAWAFPYGQAQADAIAAILKELFPKEKPQMSLVSFLTAKEIFGNKVSDWYYSPEFHEKALKQIKKDLKRFRNLFPKGTDMLYMGAAMVDRSVGPELNYPGIDVIHATASRLKEELEGVK